MKLPAAIKPESITAIIDTREQTPLDLSPLRSERGTLDTGDLHGKGLESVIRIERKSLEDLVACVGRERERFDKEVQRLLAYPVRVLLGRVNMASHRDGRMARQGNAAQVEGSLLGWVAAGLTVELVGTHARAGKYAARLLYTVARRRYRELRELVTSQRTGQPTT